MHSDSVAQQYQRALHLAEAGHHQQALEQIVRYLQAVPNDGKALNDAGTLLFCLQRGTEAISYYEKALQHCQGDDRAQVYWNLCEACLQEGRPEQAAVLFSEMRKDETLNVDILNRTANIFLEKDQLGRAMEVLRYSLKLSPNQKILSPMMKVIYAKRDKAVVISDYDSITSQMLTMYLDSLMPTQRWIGNQMDSPPEPMNGYGFSVFVGIGKTLLECIRKGAVSKAIVVLTEQDLSNPLLEQVDFSVIGTLVVCADTEVVDCLREQAPSLSMVRADNVPDAESMPLYDKPHGKQIAAVGPWNARANPMFLLQCFQKLHYIDSEYRLHLAGVFEDPALERYLNRMIVAMKLENVVFLDGPVKNLTRWFEDKHYIVSAAIDAGMLGGVWAGTAFGLTPLVHRFAGVEEMFNAEAVFDLAEDFCDLVGNNSYDAQRSRQMAQQRFEQNGLAPTVHRVICDQESQRLAEPPSVSMQPTAADNEPTIPLLDLPPLQNKAEIYQNSPI
ncbi:MAG: tetratricopeptide repeat protein [Planctomycetota bacterium]|jgi:tetratricopeptide (TPR) repeat protein